LAIIITGNPGVGKHSISKKLGTKLGLKIFDLNQIALETGFFKKNHGAIDVDVTKLKKIMPKKISRNSIIVGHLASYVVPKKYVNIAIVLRKNPYKLVSVYKKRKYPNQKLLDNIGSEILGIISYDVIRNFGRDKTFEINVSSKTTTSIIKKIINIFNGKSKSDYVDWLTLVSERNDLNRFFSY